MMWRNRYQLGDVRVRRGFAWWPVTDGEYTVWLGWYYWKEKLSHGYDGRFWSFCGNATKSEYEEYKRAQNTRNN